MLRSSLVRWAEAIAPHRRPKRSFMVSASRRTDPHTRAPPKRHESDTPVLPSKSGRKASLYAPVADHHRQQRSSTATSSKRSGGDTVLPDDMFEDPRPTRAAERRARLEEILNDRHTSVVDVTTGGELDIPQRQSTADFHRENILAIPEASSLYQSVLDADSLESRARYSTWDVATRQPMEFAETKTATSDPRSQPEPTSGSVLSTTPYRTTFSEVPTLAPYVDAVAATRSTYALRKLHPDGVATHPNVITEMEEVGIIREALRLTQSTSAAYIAEECRYCVNVFEDGLGVPTRDPLAFPLSSCPALQKVFQRLYDLQLLPMLPNLIQISEFTNTFSGYPPHRKTPAVGTYLGLLNLVSTGILHMQHQQFPWAPRLSCPARTLIVVEPPTLYEYSIGYSQTHQPFHNFDYGTRLSKDYRLEILFATVPVQQSKLLRESVALTQAGRRLCHQLPDNGIALTKVAAGQPDSDRQSTPPSQATPVKSSSSSWGTDEALRALARPPLSANTSSKVVGPPVSAAAAQAALGRLVGAPRRMGSSTSSATAAVGATSAQAEAKKRMDLLRARYEAATAAVAVAGKRGGVPGRSGGT